MDDLISRQAAIDAVKEYFTFSPLEGRQCAKAIERVPSAHPKVLAHGEGELSAQQEQRWIPCSERLPEDGLIVIMTVRYISETSYLPPFVDTGYILKGKWYSVSGEDFSKVIADVIAWMPLSEPYKGDES